MILKYLAKKDWCFMAVCVALVIGQVYLELLVPKCTQNIIEKLSTPGTTVDTIIGDGWMMLGYSVASLALAVITGLIAARIGASLGNTLRERQFDNVQSFSAAEINRFSTASLITRSTNDVTQIQMVVAVGLVVIIRAPTMAIIALGHIIDEDIRWTTAMAITLAAVLIIILVVMVYVTPRFKKIQWFTDDLNRVTRENLTGTRVIRAYNAEDYQEKKFEKTNGDLTKNNMSAYSVLIILMPLLTALIGLLSVAIYYIGALVINENIGDPSRAIEAFSQMAVFSQYATQVIISVIMVVVIFMVLPRAVVAARRVEEIINTKVSIIGGDRDEGEKGHEGEVEFRNVSFTYPGSSESVISNITFSAKKGETVAFIGSTGSGKSTIVNLVPRFYDATEGEILIDGVNIKEFNLKSLYARIGYVPQKAVIFSGTIDSNIRIGAENSACTQEELNDSIEIAQASEFVSKLVDGVNSKVSQGGTNLSGGQKQRISIARAICRKPEFYIFDDSFSALDYKTDKALRKTLKEKTKGVTTLIVAQRIGTVTDADKIVVVDNGRIVGIGKHRELLGTCEVYREIALSQLSEEELQ